IWAFENPTSQTLDLPVPYVSAYIQRSAKAENKSEFPFYEIIGVAGLSPPGNIQSKNGNKLIEFTCPNQQCKSRYFVYLTEKYFYCPICRKKIDIKEHVIVEQDKELEMNDGGRD
ncbi:MAG: hypothetical protein ACP5OE_09830, partial [Thermodesulfobium sp.]